MNRYFLLIFSTLSSLIGGCSSQLIQITTMEKHPVGREEAFNESRHDSVTVAFNFWGEEGMIQLTVENRHSAMMVLDFARSGVVLGNEAVSYEESQIFSEIFLQEELPSGHPIRIQGTATIPKQGNRVGIPSHSVMTFQRMPLPLPSPVYRHVRNRDQINIIQQLFQDRTTMRHLLCYTLTDLDGEPIILEDHFDITSSVLMNSSSFRHFVNGFEAQRPSLTHYRAIQNPHSDINRVLAMTAGTLAFTGILTFIGLQFI